MHVLFSCFPPIQKKRIGILPKLTKAFLRNFVFSSFSNNLNEQRLSGSLSHEMYFNKFRISFNFHPIYIQGEESSLSCRVTGLEEISCFRRGDGEENRKEKLL
mmetsp:Transcript_4866/g.7510  ORF Transcript_4866/g.7510 Transcript_4866/m.7510 type:complete len:103 (-) Transcript_4866:28-336(-)